MSSKDDGQLLLARLLTALRMAIRHSVKLPGPGRRGRWVLISPCSPGKIRGAMDRNAWQTLAPDRVIENALGD